MWVLVISTSAAGRQPPGGAELLREHEDPQVAEAGRFVAECVRAMADTVRLVGSLRRFATVPYPGSEKMLDPSCLEGEEQWSI